ncbi:MAG: alanine--glyoxylate aminotransferase family protein [Myxococcales bacterium]|nr:alanine--glyoxylate aminotransferase family protein [Myxococcales bacterium]
MQRQPHLMAPGPTPLPPEVQQALARPALYHRSAAFKALMGRVQTGLRAVFQTDQPVLVLTSSGTGAMEAAVCNLFARGDAAVCVNGGKFGERWGKLLGAYGCEAIEITVPWGQPVTVDAVRAALDANPAARAVCVQATETSTATRHPVAELAALVRSYDGRRGHDVLLLVDGITAVGVDDLPMDTLGIDVMLAGSQKAFMLPPGLAFAALSERAWRASGRSDLPKFYFDLTAERKNQAGGATTYTPATALVVALEEALALIAKEGLPHTFARHARLAAATRAGVQALGLGLCSTAPANAVTACWAPPGVDAEVLRKSLLANQNLYLAGGQDQWLGRILRVGHLGWFQGTDILATMAALEVELARIGHPFPPGAGTCAAAGVLWGDAVDLASAARLRHDARHG